MLGASGSIHLDGIHRGCVVSRSCTYPNRLKTGKMNGVLFTLISETFLSPSDSSIGFK